MADNHLANLKKYINILLFCLSLLLFTRCSEQIDSKLIESVFFNGNKKTACWLLIDNKNEKDSTKRFLLEIVLVPENRISARSYAIPEKILPYFSESNLHHLVLKGDRIWCILPDSSIEARNIFTGEVCETTEGIAQKFPKFRDVKNQLKSFSLLEDGFYIRDPKGIIHFYEIGSSTLYEKNQWIYYRDSMLKLQPELKNTENIVYQNQFKTLSYFSKSKSLEITDKKTNKSIHVKLEKIFSNNLESNKNMIVFFQNQILIQDKNSAKFAVSLNPNTGETVWHEQADSVFNRIQRSLK